jgi:hypothetical protein
MPSPFPGMDPYLEAHWGDVHTRLVMYGSDQLQVQLPRELHARVEERVSVELPTNGWPIYPDIHVLEPKRGKRLRKSASNGHAAALAAPLIVEKETEVTDRFIEIRDASSGHKLVTVIEILSPSNKYAGPARDQYLEKRWELDKGRVGLVEIDLLRAGPRPFPFHADLLPADYLTPYHAWVCRGWVPNKAEVYRMPLQERLPAIAIPLRQTDKDVALDLQALIDECYRNGRYENDLDYQHDPDPPLTTPHARWADSLLRKARHRKRNKRRR